MAPVDVRVPGDKSITHRALILGSLAEGTSRLARPLDSGDTRSTAGALRGLGVDVSGLDRGHTVVRGAGLTGWRACRDALDCGNSGTTARLLLGALAGCPFESRLIGDPSLQRRPMRRVTEPLSEGGAVFEELAEPGRLPIRVRGRRPLRPLAHDGPRASAQVKTALLLAALTGQTSVRVSEPGLSRDHTERMLASMGAGVAVRSHHGRTDVSLDASPRLEPLDLAIPGDPSSAAFFLGLGALLGAVRALHVGLNPTRIGAVHVLARMGAAVRIEPTGEEAGEPVGDIIVGPGTLGGTIVDAAEVPALLDEIPLLAAVAAMADGETRFDGVAELRVKESDRVAALAANLRAVGVAAEDQGDRLVVGGTGGRLRGMVRSFDDHRIAMAFGVLAALPGNEIIVDGREAAGISYPGFWTELDRVTMELGAK
ncbi:MAG TPA: 3-phosphoshikimate 1-carboxyvinyltransferase [Longimicrobiales bacterium]|nr:3-phosphoshikimate 1-carboxyvinyltransferase [Longimicrobiales bacterium]